MRSALLAGRPRRPVGGDRRGGQREDPLTPRPHSDRPTAVFAGLCTLDIIQSVDRVPRGNEKLVAGCQTVAAGGPATNAAVTFAALGGSSTLLTGVGTHPLTSGIRADLTACGVNLVDLAPGRESAPAVSSIMVTASTGERAVVSTNAVGERLRAPADLGARIRACSAVQIDGHHPDLAMAVLAEARTSGEVLTIMDGGSWKPGTEQMLPLLDVVVCSADFHPPSGPPGDPAATAAHLAACGVPWVVITRGELPILWWGPGGGFGQVQTAQVDVVDTLGAGDVFHGAVTFELAMLAPAGLDQGTMGRALARASEVAGNSCAAFGTRSWLAGRSQR